MGVGRNGAHWRGDGPETGTSTIARRTFQGGVWKQHPTKRKSLEGQQGGSRPTSWGGENEWEMWVPGGAEKDMEVETYMEEETGDERMEQIKADAQDMKEEIQRESRPLGGQQ